MKTIDEIIKNGVITTEDDFNTFVRNSNDINTDENGITDVRIYLINKDVFCEIYADMIRTEDEDYLEAVLEQEIRYFANSEQYFSYNDMMNSLKQE